MQVGAIFPQVEIAPEVGQVRTYLTEVERLGFGHLAAYDHVVGADRTVHQGFSGPYDLTSRFQEPLVLFGFAAATTRLELVTSVLILPQRQTVLVAKQAAQVDLLAEGRFRLGVGVGWNPVEYEALGEDFTRRGQREEDPQVPPDERLHRARSIIAEAAAAAGRDPATIGMEGRVSWRSGGLAKVVDHAGRWRDAEATHLAVNTMGAGFEDLGEHLEALAAVSDALGLR